VEPVIRVVYRGDPPFEAEIVENVERYEFNQPDLAIHFVDGHVEARSNVLMVMSAPSAGSD
jgi:hypothetical protein